MKSYIEGEGKVIGGDMKEEGGEEKGYINSRNYLLITMAGHVKNSHVIKRR